MKKKNGSRYVFIFLINTIFLLTGCGTVEQTIYLGDVDVIAPICTPPTHVNINKDAGNITFSPTFSVINSNTTIIGTTEDRYRSIFKLNHDTKYEAKTQNLTWNTSNFTLGLDVDYKAWKNFSIFGGFNYSYDGQKNSVGANIGVGFHNHATNPVVRFDIGFTIQDYHYTAITIVNTKTTSIFGSEDSWSIFTDRGVSTNVNPFFTLTFNSAYDSSQFNWFVTFGFFTQNLLGFEPGTSSFPLFPFLVTYTKVDERSDMLAGFVYLNPGISISIDRQIRLLLSAKINYEVLATHSNKFYVMPTAKIDFQL